MSVVDNKVIGYFAFMSSGQVACDGPSCLILSSEKDLRKYLSFSYPKDIDRFTIKKTRFGEIMKGLSLGAPYAFDREAYRRFYPLAKKVGYALDQAKFPDQDFDSRKFMHVFPNEKV